MKGRLADFYFVGLGVAPVALMFGGLPHVALLIFILLLFVACCFGMAEQIEDAEKPNDGSDAGKGAPPRDAPRLTYKRRDPSALD
jgi:hypothetical protein